MDQDDHYSSSGGRDAPREPLSRQPTHTRELSLETQDESASLHGRAPSTQSLEPSSASRNPEAMSPSSTIAPSFHTASSFLGNSDTQQNADGDGTYSLGLGFETERGVSRAVLPSPSLSIDTSCSPSETSNQVARTSHLSPVSPFSEVARSATLKSPSSPVSPRTRDRGSSLRRSILAPKIPGKAKSSGVSTELKAISRPAEFTPTLTPSDEAGNKAEAMIIVSSTQKEAENGDKKPYAVSSLPHYETWIASKAARKGLWKRVRVTKEQIRKKILRIREIPPSKNGRQIQLDLHRRNPPIDDRTGNEYINNTILSSRYNLYNFLPRQLFAQFSKLANFYFLCVSILQMIPGLSTTGTYTTIVPLLFFVTISIAKEGYDDLRRYRLDKAENNRTAYILHARQSGPPSNHNSTGSSAITGGSEHWVETKWRDIRVGDIVKLSRDDAVPADIAVLQARGTADVAYIETMALDGETNLKSKQASPPLSRSCRSVDELAKCDAHLVLEDPNLDLYNFEGKVTVKDESFPLTNNEIIYRGSIVRNTSEVTGVAIYTGEECKIRMNATKNPRIKAPTLQAVVNKVVIILVIFVLLLAVFNTAAYQFWQEDVEENSWYLEDAKVAFFPILVSFIILFNTMIPLSLYVSLEIVKLFQMLLLNDIEMYDDASNTPMEARTSTINEELGQVNYIFSDKTGTLTNNSMRFRKLSIAGTSWLHDPDIQEDAVKEANQAPPIRKRHSKGKKPMWRRTSTSGSGERSAELGTAPDTLRSPDRNSSTASHWRAPARYHTTALNTRELIRYIQHRPTTLFARKVRVFLLSVALCHTCIPETKADGQIEYQAASPDEQALVRAAQELGYIMVDRQNGIITIKRLPVGSDGESVLEKYEVLDIIEFSSSRKRMSVVVRMPDHRICVFCKGADSTLTRIMRLSGLALSKAVEVERMANNRRSLEAQEAIRRESEAKSRKNSMARKSMSIHRPSMGGITRQSMNGKRLEPIRDDLDDWLRQRETSRGLSGVNDDSIFYSPPRSSAHYGSWQHHTSFEGRYSFQGDDRGELVEEALVASDAAVFERCFQHINDYATEGLRTLLYGFRYIEEEEYKEWKEIYLDASTSLNNRQEMIEKAGAMVERDLELAGATAIEDKLQDGVPEAVDKLRRAKIKLWMLTGDKRETAINIGHSCRLIKDYSTVAILDNELGDVGQRIAAATLGMSNEIVAHSVVVVDGQTLSDITASEPLRKLFLSLAILVDTVICCRASPAQKASLVSSIRHKVKNAVTLAIGDGANDIAMIQEAHVGIGITGREGLQAARTSDYSIAQFRFLTKLLLVHGRWNYNRTCKYTLGTFWKEMLFYLTQALYQRWAGYTGTSLYESWSLAMFNTLFTSLPVIFMGIFEQDLTASTLLAVPELYHSLGHHNGGFNIKKYLVWVAMAAAQAVVVFFIMFSLYGQALFTTDNGLYAMGDLTFTACIIIIATKMQFWEIYNKTYTCAISMFASIGGWFLWNVILSSTYTNNVIYNVKDGFFDRFGRNPLWWLTLILIVVACWALELGIRTMKGAWMPSDADVFRQLEKDPAIKRRFEEAAAVGLAAHVTHGGQAERGSRNHIRPERTAEEDRQREGEVQEMLDRPRHSRRSIGNSHEVEIEHADMELRRRQHSEPDAKSAQEHKVSFAVADRGLRDDDDGDDNDMRGKEKPKRRSTDVHELLKRGFGSVRRSLDTV